MTRRAAKIDANHVELTEAMRKCGYLVRSTAAVGRGFVDAIAFRHDRVYLVEFKGEKGRLTPDQEAFIAEGWPVHIVKNIDDVLTLASASPEAT